MRTPNAEQLIERRLGEMENDRFIGDVTIQLPDLTPEETAIVYSNWKKRQYRPREVPGTRIAQWQAKSLNGVPSVSFMVHATRSISRREIIGIYEYVRVGLIQKWIGREIGVSNADVLFRPGHAYAGD